MAGRGVEGVPCGHAAGARSLAFAALGSERKKEGGREREIEGGEDRRIQRRRRERKGKGHRGDGIRIYES